MKRITAHAAGLLMAALLVACTSAPQPPQAIEHFERAMRGGIEQLAAGDLARARATFRAAVRAAEIDDSGDRRAQALLSVGAVSALLEDESEAKNAYAEALREARLAGNGHSMALARAGLADLARRQGDAVGALALYGLAEENLALAGDATERLQAENGRAVALLATGQSDQAMAVVDQIEQQARRTAPGVLAATLANRAALLQARDQLPLALTNALEALTLDRISHQPSAVAADQARLAQIYAALGQMDAAQDALDRAVRIFRHTGQTRAIERLVKLRASWSALE